jgi:hypothetical protein
MDGFFNGFASFAGALLNPSQQFILRAFGEGQVVIRERAPFLFQFTFGYVPVAFNLEFRHRFFRHQCDSGSAPAVDPAVDNTVITEYVLWGETRL